MHIDLNRYRQAIEKWVAILLLLMFGWLAVGCVLEVYAEDKESNVQVLENKIGSR